jgi:hypothetical protein
MTHRSRKLLDVARDAPCMLRLVTCEGQVTAAHSDQLEDGRGYSHKSHDCLAIPACMACHAWFTRKNLGREEYERVHSRAFKKYQVWLWENGYIVLAHVSGKAYVYK